MPATVSIIIANYNYGQYLAEAIESALAQTWPHCEIVFIDDGSADDSLAVASRYPITVLKQANQGVSAARNNAVAQAKGDYLLFLDADDRLLPSAVEHLLKALEAAPAEVAYAYGQMQYFGYKSGLFASAPFDAKRLRKENYICVTCLMRKSAFEQVGGFDRTIKSREDWELFVRLLHRGWHGVLLPEPIMDCRKHRPPAIHGVKDKLQKATATARLFWRYPRFFLPLAAKKPFRHAWVLLSRREARRPGAFGPTETPQIVKATSTR